MELVGVFHGRDVYLHDGVLYFKVNYDQTNPVNCQRTDFVIIEGEFVTKLTGQLPPAKARGLEAGD